MWLPRLANRHRFFRAFIISNKPHCARLSVCGLTLGCIFCVLRVTRWTLTFNIRIWPPCFRVIACQTAWQTFFYSLVLGKHASRVFERVCSPSPSPLTPQFTESVRMICLEETMTHTAPARVACVSLPQSSVRAFRGSAGEKRRKWFSF